MGRLGAILAYYTVEGNNPTVSFKIPPESPSDLLSVLVLMTQRSVVRMKKSRLKACLS